jgi:hypothetical protein
VASSNHVALSLDIEASFSSFGRLLFFSFSSAARLASKSSQFSLLHENHPLVSACLILQ